MKIILDTLGGDHHPGEIIKGGLEAIGSYNVEIAFCGRRGLIQKELDRFPHLNGNFSIIHAQEEITMEDSPIQAIKRKKKSSLVKGTKALRKEADALVSPSNTGAVMAASILKLGRISGISRPGIATVLPTINGKGMVVIDVGANVDCKPKDLAGFAVMGNVYAQNMLGIKRPAVGLLFNGQGNQLISNTIPLLENSSLNYIGNVESNHLLTHGEADVVVCDGFAGNVVLKAYEGATETATRTLKRALSDNLRSKLGGLFLMPTLKKLKKTMSSSEYGGAVLLGVKGVVIICHGESDAEAIKNAIGVAKSMVERNLVEMIKKGVEEYS